MPTIKGHEGLMLTGALTALAFTPQGLPRRQRATAEAIAAASAPVVAQQIQDAAGRLWQRRQQTRSRVKRLALDIRAARCEHLGHRYGAGWIADHVRELLRDCRLADHLKGGSFAPNLIPNSGEGFLVDAWQGLTTLANMKYHGVGTGTNAPAETDTDLQTPCTTALNPDNTRATGSLGEASPSVFRSLATVTFDAIAQITEWGLFSQAALPGGVMFSRVVGVAIPVGIGESIQYTYDLTVE